MVIKKLFVCIIASFIVSSCVFADGKTNSANEVFSVKIKHEILMCDWSENAKSFFYLTENHLSLVPDITNPKPVFLPVSDPLLKKYQR